MAAAVRCMTGAISSRNMSFIAWHISPNVRLPSANSHNMLFISSNGRRNSVGARRRDAIFPSIRPNCLGILSTTRRPLTPLKAGSLLTSPVLAHQTGVLHGYWSTSGWFSMPASSSMVSPSKFNPCPHEQRQHRCRAQKGNGSRRLHTLSKMAKVPCSHATSSHNKPQGVPCGRIGVHATLSSKGSIKVLLAVVRPLLLCPAGR